MDTTPSYKADFNDGGDEGLVTTLPGWGGSVLVPTVDQLVELVDGDGNLCLGFVVRVNPNALIYVRPDWSSWRDAPDVSALPTIEDALNEAMRAIYEGQKTSTREEVPK
jgi:hypothetical protein